MTVLSLNSVGLLVDYADGIILITDSGVEWRYLSIIQEWRRVFTEIK